MCVLEVGGRLVWSDMVGGFVIRQLVEDLSVGRWLVG